MDQVRTNVPESPVDNAARRQLAELIERLVAGELTTDKFAAQAQELALGSSDPAVDAIYLAADSFYSDLWSYRLRGRRAATIRSHTCRALGALSADLHPANREASEPSTPYGLGRRLPPWRDCDLCPGDRGDPRDLAAVGRAGLWGRGRGLVVLVKPASPPEA